METDKFLLGIDPGRDKTGLALVDAQGNIVQVEVVPTTKIKEILPSKAVSASRIIMGDGTTSGTMKELVQKLLPEKELVLVDERHSTEEARKLYWQVNPPQGLKRLLPQGMLVPDGNMDGYAAVILVRRYLKIATTATES
jgi:RNase H-fold protein (predicted Holliday junction resolvase)